MILAVNIGNTNTACALYRRGGLCGQVKVQTAAYMSAGGFLELAGITGRVSGAVIASVVPEKTAAVATAAEFLSSRAPLLIEDAASCGLDVSAYDVSLLGVDRVVCCVGALAKYAPPLAVFDLGTAVSVSVADGDRRFLGGAILPGMRMGLSALAQGASLLPDIGGLSGENDVPPIGRDTAGCMIAGAVYGIAGAIDGYSRHLRHELGEIAPIATGGSAPAVLPNCFESFRHEPNLLTDGLLRLWIDFG